MLSFRERRRSFRESESIIGFDCDCSKQIVSDLPLFGDSYENIRVNSVCDPGKKGLSSTADNDVEGYIDQLCSSERQVSGPEVDLE